MSVFIGNSWGIGLGTAEKLHPLCNTGILLVSEGSGNKKKESEQTEYIFDYIILRG